MVTIPGAENINYTAYLEQSIVWLGYGLILFLVVALFAIAYYLMRFKIKAVVVPIVGSGVEQGYSLGKITSNRFGWNKSKTAWVAMKPLFNKVEFQPFESRYIYVDQRVVAFQLPDGKYIAGNINLSQNESKALMATIDPIPSYLRRYDELAMKQDEVEFSNQSTWDKYGSFVTILVVGLLCCIMVGVTVYFTYKYAGPGLASTDRLANAIEKLGTIPGAPR